MYPVHVREFALNKMIVLPLVLLYPTRNVSKIDIYSYNQKTLRRKTTATFYDFRDL